MIIKPAVICGALLLTAMLVTACSDEDLADLDTVLQSPQTQDQFNGLSDSLANLQTATEAADAAKYRQ
jgi:hypothetical protein